MIRVVPLLLLLSAPPLHANEYNLSSEKAEAVKQVTLKSITPLEEQSNQINVPKVDAGKAFAKADLFEKGNLKVTKKISVLGKSGDSNTADFSYNVNIGIKLSFI